MDFYKLFKNPDNQGFEDIQNYGFIKFAALAVMQSLSYSRKSKSAYRSPTGRPCRGHRDSNYSSIESSLNTSLHSWVTRLRLYNYIYNRWEETLILFFSKSIYFNNVKFILFYSNFTFLRCGARLRLVETMVFITLHLEKRDCKQNVFFLARKLTYDS